MTEEQLCKNHWKTIGKGICEFSENHTQQNIVEAIILSVILLFIEHVYRTCIMIRLGFK